MSEAERNLRTALRESMRINGDVRQKREWGDMDAQKIINALGGIVFAFLGWWSNNIWSAVQGQQAQITQLNVELAKNYVPRVELQASFDRIFSKLDSIDRQTKGNR